MRRLLLIAIVGCGSSAPKPAPAPAPVPIATPIVPVQKTCTDAAFGIDRAAKDLHPPEHEVVPPMRTACARDAWPQRAVDCFAALTSDDPSRDQLSGCVAELPAELRAPLLAELTGVQPDQTAALAEVATKLASLQVGIASCDRFVAAVRAMMSCEGLEAERRIQLGTETVEAWALPMDRVSLPDKARLAGACTQSLESLKRHAADLACTL